MRRTDLAVLLKKIAVGVTVAALPLLIIGGTLTLGKHLLEHSTPAANIHTSHSR